MGAENDQDLEGEPEIIYLGSRGGMEERIVKTESRLPYQTIPTAALRGRGPRTFLPNLGLLVVGTLVATNLLRRLCPAAILGTGGYGCVPVFLAASMLHIPTLLYLPDVVPGFAVRLLAHVATRVASSVEDSRPYFRHLPSLVVSGYPVRRELYHLDRDASRAAFGFNPEMPVLLVYGGSRGARNINRAIEALLPDLLPWTQIIHLCGREGDEVWLRKAAERLEPSLAARYWLAPYLETPWEAERDDHRNRTAGKITMATAFGAADLALCRSGASVLGELPMLGLPAVLIPYPHVHQDENADYLVRHGAAVKIADHAMLGNGNPREGPLFNHLYRLLRTDTQERLQMASRIRELARPEAAHCLATVLRDLATRRKDV